MKDSAGKILVVDDESNIADVVKSFLESKGYAVVTADTGPKAMDVFLKEPISLIVLDLMLPGLSGEEVCRAIRKRSRVPIIMLTAKSEEENMLEGLGIGADDYITRPLSLKALHARIEAVLRRSSADLAPLFRKYSFNGGDLVIDYGGHAVYKNGTEVKLTPNEFNLLIALVKYPNRVFSRDELISIAFDNEFEGYDRAVDSHIKNLRKKIETDPKRPVYILTIHGVGYKFGGS